MRNYDFLVLLLCCCFGCSDKVVQHEYVALNNGVWKKSSSVDFEIGTVDSLSKHNVFLNIRNDDRYEFSNLFLIVQLQSPDGNTQVDTLEYEMAAPTGEWLGKGMGSVKESKLWYKKNIDFPSSGVYKLHVSHAMRKNGEVDGLENLTGITDVGIEVEKIQ